MKFVLSPFDVWWLTTVAMVMGTMIKIASGGVAEMRNGGNAES